MNRKVIANLDYESVRATPGRCVVLATTGKVSYAAYLSLAEFQQFRHATRVSPDLTETLREEARRAAIKILRRSLKKKNTTQRENKIVIAVLSYIALFPDESINTSLFSLMDKHIEESGGVMIEAQAQSDDLVILRMLPAVSTNA